MGSMSPRGSHWRMGSAGSRPRSAECPYKEGRGKGGWESWKVNRMYKTTFVCTGCRESARLDFLCALSSIREKTFRGNVIRKAFHETGLAPYQPEVILQKLKNG
ncbi:hypothetical protein T310_9930 [Rasamsonia emersonii CBS 393.64]|uniref:Uncharacterized protein n=1 Tax=Rasamsonia emersonii (strain ATCC 16479 / CBS 393.64 / IMI 116815) TaxID=1408163 RepID=A0A0F4YE72_RASE3|nr:hypothetical protein T310_9930 [Rasamsonia emersonii CBS 393.64]KKA16484.1 hypothetical protein T310_9930 [Rasamsonia emersonii CBS 393.64]